MIQSAKMSWCYCGKCVAAIWLLITTMDLPYLDERVPEKVTLGLIPDVVCTVWLVWTGLVLLGFEERFPVWVKLCVTGIRWAASRTSKRSSLFDGLVWHMAQSMCLPLNPNRNWKTGYCKSVWVSTDDEQHFPEVKFRLVDLVKSNDTTVDWGHCQRRQSWP